MITSFSLEKENMIKDTRNLFRLKIEINYTAVKDIKNLFGLEKETKAIKDQILSLDKKKKIIINQ